MHQIRFRLGLYSAPPDSLAGFKGPTSKGREGGRGGKKEREGGREREGKREERGKRRGGEGPPPPTAFWTNRTLVITSVLVSSGCCFIVCWMLCWVSVG